MKEKTTIGDFFNLVGGGTPNTKNETYWGEGIPWISSADINEFGETVYRRKVTQKGIDESTTNAVPIGTLIVVTRVGLGKVAVAPYKLCFSQDMQALLPKNESVIYESRYLLYQLLYRMSRKKYFGQGTTISGITKKQLSECSIYLPEISEQQRIVSRIEELFSSLDNAVETLRKTKEQLAVYRQAVLKEAFEGNLTKKWRSTNHKDNEWKVVSITDVIKADKNALKAGPFGSSLKKEMYAVSGYKIYGQEQVIAGDEEIGDYFIGENKFQELITCRIAPKDVLISLVGTVGKVLVLSDNCKPGIINPRLIKVSLDQNKMLPYYFKYYFESGYLRSRYKEKAHGATMDVLNMGMIKELPFSWCPIEEQRQVISEIESRMSMCDSIDQTVDTALAQAEAMRQTILKEAFEGRL